MYVYIYIYTHTYTSITACVYICFIPIPLPKIPLQTSDCTHVLKVFYKLRCSTNCLKLLKYYTEVFYKLSWAWAWV